jgi:hypothetical protein
MTPAHRLSSTIACVRLSPRQKSAGTWLISRKSVCVSTQLTHGWMGEREAVR